MNFAENRGHTWLQPATLQNYSLATQSVKDKREHIEHCQTVIDDMNTNLSNALLDYGFSKETIDNIINQPDSLLTRFTKIQQPASIITKKLRIIQLIQKYDDKYEIIDSVKSIESELIKALENASYPQETITSVFTNKKTKQEIIKDCRQQINTQKYALQQILLSLGFNTKIAGSIINASGLSKIIQIARYADIILNNTETIQSEKKSIDLLNKSARELKKPNTEQPSEIHLTETQLLMLQRLRKKEEKNR